MALQVKTAAPTNPACIRCWEAKTKCERVFPCKRCISQGFECLPHLSKKQMRNNPVEQKRIDYRPIFAKMVQDGKQPRETMKRILVWKLTRARLLGNPHWVQAVEFAINACGFELSEICPHEEHKSQAQATEELSRFESWVPQKFICARKASYLPQVCTVFTVTCHGYSHHETNDLFQETFGTAEEMGVDLIGREVPDLSHRIIAEVDREQYTKDMFASAQTQKGRDEWESHSSCSLENIYHCVNKQGKKVLTFVQRHAWLDKSGYISAYFGLFRVLPESKHRIRTVTRQSAKRAKTTKSSKQPATAAPQNVKHEANHECSSSNVPNNPSVAAASTPRVSVAEPVAPEVPFRTEGFPDAANSTTDDNTLDAAWGCSDMPLPAVPRIKLELTAPVDMSNTKDQENLSDLIISLLDDPAFFGSPLGYLDTTDFDLSAELSF